MACKYKLIWNVFTNNFDYVNDVDSIVDDILIELDNVIVSNGEIVWGDVIMLADNDGNLLQGAV